MARRRSNATCTLLHCLLLKGLKVSEADSFLLKKDFPWEWLGRPSFWPHCFYERRRDHTRHVCIYISDMSFSRCQKPLQQSQCRQRNEMAYLEAASAEETCRKAWKVSVSAGAKDGNNAVLVRAEINRWPSWYTISHSMENLLTYQKTKETREGGRLLDIGHLWSFF